MTDFPTLFYESTSETPTLSYTGILKKVPLWAFKKKKQKQKHKSTFNLGLSTEILILGICSFQYFVKDKLI